uniref:Uncharacterized protein n=1 Tax=Tetranychus urticae TaxID=32264 RepID=T1KZC2_TETUR
MYQLKKKKIEKLEKSYDFSSFEFQMKVLSQVLLQ